MADYHVKHFSQQLDKQENDPRSSGGFTLFFPCQQDQTVEDMRCILEQFSPIKTISNKKGRFIIRYESRQNAMEALNNVDVLRVLSINDEDYDEDESSPVKVKGSESNLSAGASGGGAEREENSKPIIHPKEKKMPRERLNVKDQDTAEIFVGRLPDDITEEKLADYFDGHDVYDQRIVPKDGRKIAFLKTFTLHGAKEIVRKLKHKKLDGKDIVVDLTNNTKERLVTEDKIKEDERVDNLNTQEKKKNTYQKYRRKKANTSAEVDSVAEMVKSIENKIKKLTEKEENAGHEINRLERDRRSMKKEIKRLEKMKDALKGISEGSSDEQDDPDQTIPMTVASSECSRNSNDNESQEKNCEDEYQEVDTQGAEKSYTLGCEGEADLSPELTELQFMTCGQLEKIYKDCVSTRCKPVEYEDLPKELEIAITHIVDKKYFWGILNNKEYAEDLERFEELRNQLQETSNHDKFIRLENKCGALYEDTYSRAWVQRISGNTATVLFIDYGNMESVNTNKLVGLPSQFWKLKPQAVPFKIADSDYFKLGEDDHYTNIKACTSTRRDNLGKDMSYVAVLDDVFPLSDE